MSAASEDRRCILPGCSLSSAAYFNERLDGYGSMDDNDMSSGQQHVIYSGVYDINAEDDDITRYVEEEDIGSWDLDLDIEDDDRSGKWKSRKKLFRSLFLGTTSVLVISLCLYAFVNHSKLPLS